ncbi:hypothetical protein [Bartonella machadoae]|nr:hypothetical protein [Bartonella machadoae]UNE54025.1 hypothetical protein LNM86_10765 [Bartonella machadoae]
MKSLKERAKRAIDHTRGQSIYSREKKVKTKALFYARFPMVKTIAFFS